jgi:hypothetical protein
MTSNREAMADRAMRVMAVARLVIERGEVRTGRPEDLERLIETCHAAIKELLLAMGLAAEAPDEFKAWAEGEHSTAPARNPATLQSSSREPSSAPMVPPVLRVVK